MTISNLMTTKDVARRLGVSPRTVQRRVEAGGLRVAHRMPGYRGDLLFDPADVDALADELATPAPKTTDSGSLARVGAPAGGRAGTPEPAPASTTDEATR